VGFYRTYVLPHLINFAMSNKDVAVRRAALIPTLPYYSSAVTHLRGVDSSAQRWRDRRSRA